MWQDIVVALANLLFGYSLLWQVIIGFKKKMGALALQTALLTTIGLYTLAVAYLTLNLYASTIIAFFNGTMWLILFLQSIIYKKN